jgi:hypothetical protein
MLEVHDGQFASHSRGDFDIYAVSHDEEPEEYGEDDGGEFEMITAVDVAQLGPPGDSGSELDGDAESDIVRTAVEVSLSLWLCHLGVLSLRRATATR